MAGQLRREVGLLSNVGSNRIREITALFPIRANGTEPSPHTELRTTLSELDHGALNAVSSLHTARWVILRQLERPSGEIEPLGQPHLLYAASFDGQLQTHLEELACVLPEEVTSIWQNCMGFPNPLTPAAFAEYVKARRTKAVFFLADRDDSAHFVRRSLEVKEKLRKLIIGSQGLPPKDAFEELERFAREEGIWHPLPPHPLETPPKGELREIRLTIELARRRLLQDYYAARSDPSTVDMARRGAHAKQHGCLDATFEVRDDIPEEFRRGVAATPRSFPAKIRFSNGSEEIQPDRTGDGRGLAIKLEGVEGQRLRDDLGEPGSQDFLLVSHENFFCKDVETYRVFRAFRDLGKLGTLLAILSLVPHPRQVVTILRLLILTKDYDLLETEYHSMTCQLWGEGRTVRLSASPVDPVTLAPISPRKEGRRDTRDYLRDVLAKRLDEANGREAAFELAIHVGTNDPALIEDPTRSWKHARRIPVATIRIAPQNFDTPERRQQGERIAFNPWNVLTAHRPLGGLNRVRLAVYLASSTLRQELNRGRRGPSS